MTRPVALLLTVLTGFSGLVYQVTWQKYLGTLLGSHSEATAAVLGIFLGGLSVGYALFGRLTRRLAARSRESGRPARLLLVYGAIEAGIGIYALLFPALFAAVEATSLAVPQLSTGFGFAIDILLCALLMGPPTILMGATIPVLTQALARSVEDATRFHALVYAFNTAGAFVGALAAGFVLVAWLGLNGVLVAMGLVNLGAGLGFALLDRRRGPLVELDPGDAMPAVRGYPAYAAVAMLTGFSMMTLETVLIRIGALSFGSSEFTFAMVVAVFVLSIALGSFVVSALPRIPSWLLLANQVALVALLLLLYRLLPMAPYGAHVLRTLFTREPLAFYPFYMAGFLGLLLAIAPAVLLSGASLPLLFHHLRSQVGDLGAVAGRLYSWNTVGSLLGALLGGYVLLFWLDLHAVFRIAVLALAFGAVLLAALTAPRPAVGLVLGGALGAWIAAVLVMLGPWDPRHLTMGVFRVRNAIPYSYDGHASFVRQWWNGPEVISYEDDPTMAVAILEQTMPDGSLFRSLTVNGKPDSGTQGDSPTQGLLGLLPALFSEPTERAFVIGLGTGITVGGIAELDSIESVTVAEISQGVIDAAPLFDFANNGVSTHEKVRIVHSDAYRALLRSEERYDVIVSAPSNPWVTGVEMLFSREFLEAARDRLTPGGVYGQWFQQYEIDTASVELVLRTYASVFEHVAVWYGAGPDLLLLGFNDPATALDLERLAERAALPDYEAGLRRAEVGSFAALLGHELLPLGVVHAADLSGPIHTLRSPLLNHQAGRAYFSGQFSDLPFTGSARPAAIGAAHSLFRRYARSFPDGLPESERAATVHEACRYRGGLCTALLGEWRHDEGETPAFRQALSAVQRRRPRFGPEVSSGRLAAIAPFFPGEPFGEGRLTATAAERYTRTYESLYRHPAPFSAARLLELWGLCEDGGGACRRGEDEARAMLGGPPGPLPTARPAGRGVVGAP